MSTGFIDIVDVSRSFGTVQALDRISMRVARGSVHAITGENGAGKSTLMKLLAGVYPPSAGEIRLAGNRVAFGSPHDALKAGVSTVFQEFSLIPNLSVAESIFLGREPRTATGGIDAAAMRSGARAALHRLGSNIDPATLVRELSVAEQQTVEIAKGVSVDAGVFIFDEPTAALNSADVGKLRKLIGELKAAGKTILYISHRLEEIFAMCDTVTVLKDGKHVSTQPAAELDEQKLVALMVGRPLGDFFPARAKTAGERVLSVSDLRVGAAAPPVSFELRRGEILGLAGLEGQGQRSIARVLAGVERAHAGRVHKVLRDGSAVTVRRETSVLWMLRCGVGLVPEDRKREGLFLDLGIDRNIALGREVAKPLFAIARDSAGVIDRMMRSMNIKARDGATKVDGLSGGNQQKVLIGRWLSSGVDVLIVEEPTRGVDVGAKADVYRLLRAFTSAGGAVLVLSREMPELIGLCDRLLVVHGGAIVAEMRADQASEHAILHSAIGSRAVA
ncbi:ABC transporter ATP-binding protein [Burkholderia cepacia]|uniref:sugar ABC transporter ATP-binding protein n=1 Tax=Burkholderia cepacia TaxID=292 RepID=UPI00075BDFE2|nr:sugar ABC transporter ATP-binding protein [Burkholderia cepacia]KVW15607.1 ABC transporter ATP-binding protein [Burkholderia cepacia]KWH32259.1 ABC transporter ATP-binding protein [Burkholderia cepacia]